MSEYGLPCFVCETPLRNVLSSEDNQPDEGTEFRTYGHYGSTFWDSFHGEELVVNICDDCLRAGKSKLGQQKRFLPITCDGMHGFGHQWVDRPMVPYTGNVDDGKINVEPEELGTPLARNVEWAENIEELKSYAVKRANEAS